MSEVVWYLHQMEFAGCLLWVRVDQSRKAREISKRQHESIHCLPVCTFFSGLDVLSRNI